MLTSVPFQQAWPDGRPGSAGYVDHIVQSVYDSILTIPGEATGKARLIVVDHLSRTWQICPSRSSVSAARGVPSWSRPSFPSTNRPRVFGSENVTGALLDRLHPPRLHPADERRELPPQGQPAERRGAIASAGSAGCQLAPRRRQSRPRRQCGGPTHGPGRGRQAPPRWYSFAPPLTPSTKAIVFEFLKPDQGPKCDRQPKTSRTRRLEYCDSAVFVPDIAGGQYRKCLLQTQNFRHVLVSSQS